MQQVKIITIKHHGAPLYLGQRHNVDTYSSNGYTNAQYLCNGWRSRYNQSRSAQKKYTDSSKTELTYRFTNVQDYTDKQARNNCSYLSAIPDVVLSSASRLEQQEYQSALKRRATLLKKGMPVSRAGKLPTFRSRKHDDQIFVCWHRQGKNATLVKTGKRTGIITIAGQNPTGKFKNDDKSYKLRWKLQFRVRLTQDIREYTSIRVNLTKMQITFTNQPGECAGNTDGDPRNPRIIGIDRGGVVPMAVSDSAGDTELIVPTAEFTRETQRLTQRKKYHQRKMTKARARAEKEGGKSAVYAVMRGNTYQHHKTQAAKYSKKLAARAYGWTQEITTEIIKNNDVIVLEDLKIQSMTRSGGRRKRGMNRSFLQALPSTIASLLEYKARVNYKQLVYVAPHHTSQRCSRCGYTHKENRESQSIFQCQHCDYVANADSNAADNIKQLYCFILDYTSNNDFSGTDLSACGILPYDPDKYRKNGSGEIVKPKISQEMRGMFFINHPDLVNLGDAIDPSTA